MNQGEEKPPTKFRARLPLGKYAYPVGQLFALLALILGILAVGTFGFWAYVTLGSIADSSPPELYVGVLGLSVALLTSAGVFHVMYDETSD
ncbi:hypothetical protein EXE43_17635 [Halorubrum sp. SS5]|nr:hypothetical protein EXE43_17635 [Halorubrum sp. SS5]